jgi:hypothetical protein
MSHKVQSTFSKYDDSALPVVTYLSNTPFIPVKSFSFGLAFLASAWYIFRIPDLWKKGLWVFQPPGGAAGSIW